MTCLIRRCSACLHRPISHCATHVRPVNRRDVNPATLFFVSAAPRVTIHLPLHWARVFVRFGWGCVASSHRHSVYTCRRLSASYSQQLAVSFGRAFAHIKRKQLNMYSAVLFPNYTQEGKPSRGLDPHSGIRKLDTVCGAYRIRTCNLLLAKQTIYR